MNLAAGENNRHLILPLKGTTLHTYQSIFKEEMGNYPRNDRQEMADSMARSNMEFHRISAFT